MTRLPKPRGRGHAVLAGIRPVLRFFRQPRSTHVTGPETVQRHARGVEPVDVGRVARVPDPFRPLRASRSVRGWSAWPLAWSPSFGSFRRAARFAPTSSRAIPGWCRSIPGGIRPRGRFIELGFFHILDGTDHLLFLLCLVIPFRRFARCFPVVTAFTVAHSITLIASAYGFAPDALWFPPLIETLIAISIVYMALENIVGTVRTAGG